MVAVNPFLPLRRRSSDNLRSWHLAPLISISATTIAVALALFIVVNTLNAVRRAYKTVPFWDAWAFVEDLAAFRSHSVGLSFLFRQHNEHRIVLPRLILWLDFVFFKFGGAFPIACTLLLQALQALVFCSVYWKVETHSPASRVAYAALVLGLLFSASQMENFVRPFQVSWVLVLLASSASIFLLLRHCRAGRSGGRDLTLSIVAVISGTLSLASGLLIWPVLALICVVERARKWTLATITTLGTLFWTWYFIGYTRPPQHANPYLSLTHPLELVSYVFTYVVSPISSTPLRHAESFGLIVSLLCVFGITLYIRNRSNSFWRACGFFVYSAIYGIATAIVTSLGRINFGLQQAASSRYQTSTLILWAGLLGLASLFCNRKAGAVAQSLITPIAVLFIFVAILLPDQRIGTAYFISEGRIINKAGLAIAVQAPDNDAYLKVHPDPELVRLYTPFLRENGVSIFADPILGAWGEPTEHLFAVVDHDQCIGAFDAVRPLPGKHPLAGEVSGWGWERRQARPVDTVVIGDNHGTVIGLATGRDLRSDVATAFRNRDMLVTGWSGYIRAQPGSRTASAFGLMADGKSACLLGQQDLSGR
jgi:hypothetical protein